MKKVLITGFKFIGEVTVLYGSDGVLITVDFSSAQMAVEQVHWLMRNIPPALIDDYVDYFPSDKFTVIVEGYEVTFDMFWRRYDKKINKPRTLNHWENMTKGDRLHAYNGLTAYEKFLTQKAEWRNKQDPHTYLKNKSWNNEWK